MKYGILNKEEQNIRISTTGYRIFIELKALMRSNMSTDELIQIVFEYSNKKISKDTVRFDINTLRNAGCVITKPTKSNDFKFQLISHPFKFSVDDFELDLFIQLRNFLAENISLNEAFILNNLLDKIFSLTLDNELCKYVHNEKLFADVNLDILNNLLNPDIISKKIQIKYNSPEFNTEILEVIPMKILYENKRIYLFAFSFKYNRNCLYDISRIEKINVISVKNEKILSKNFTVKYEVNNIKDFNIKPYEKIIEKNENKLIIEANVDNDFMFIQRLLLLGENFKIISPDFFRDKLIEKIKLIQKRYLDDNN